MYEWNEAIQKMIDWIEAHLTENPTLPEMSKQIGYSPYYCSTRFHEICGMTIKSYISGRRLALAALAVRDTSDRILDIAMKYGFSSQESLTRAFRTTLGCTPAMYRENPVPVPLPIKKVIYFPDHYQTLHQGGFVMSQTTLTDARVRVEYIPAHRYIGIWDDQASGYGDFFAKHDCDAICGIIDSMQNVSHPIVTPHTAGWYPVNGKRGYFYGFGVFADYDGIVPEGFAIREFPASYYLVFYHPSFDYLKDNDKVMEKVETLAWNYDLENEGNSGNPLSHQDRRSRFVWNEDVCQCYQRHYPEGIGYEILRPVKIRNHHR